MADVVLIDGDLDAAANDPDWSRCSSIRCSNTDRGRCRRQPRCRGHDPARCHQQRRRCRPASGGDRRAWRSVRPAPPSASNSRPTTSSDAVIDDLIATARRQPDRRAMGTRHGRDESAERRRRRRGGRGHARPLARRRRAARRRSLTVAVARPRGTARHSRTLREARPRIRPTSNSRRWLRRGANTAPTRPSAPRSICTTRDSVTSIEPLMRQLRNSTEALDAPFVRSAFVGNAGVVEFTPGTTHRGQGRNAQPPVGRRTVRWRQHRRRRRDPRRARHGAPPDRGHRRVVFRSGRPADRRAARRVAAPAAHPGAVSSTGSPTTATRSACRPSPARSSTTRPTPPIRSCSPDASASRRPAIARRSARR